MNALLVRMAEPFRSEHLAMAAAVLPSVAEHSDVLVYLLAGAAALIQGLLYRRACSIDRKLEKLMAAVYGEGGLLVRLAIVEHECARNHKQPNVA